MQVYSDLKDFPYKILSLQKSNIACQNCCLVDYFLLLGWPIFRGDLSFKECIYKTLSNPDGFTEFFYITKVLMPDI